MNSHVAAKSVLTILYTHVYMNNADYTNVWLDTANFSSIARPSTADAVSNQVNVLSDTLSVSLTANPISGNIPLVVNLTANVGGSATGTINYYFWWDCANTTTNASLAETACGVLPNPSPGNCATNAVGARCNALPGATNSQSKTYIITGIKTAKVIAERGFAPPAQAQQSITVNPSIPNSPSSVTVTPPDYCMSGPAATITWTYSDPSGSPQSAYEVQMDEEGSFQVPEYQTGKVLSNSNSNFTGQGVLLFSKTYKTRVRVWNSYDQVSGWTVAGGNFNTPPYAYPQVDFSWTANGILNNPSPPLNKPVQFTDATVFNGNPNGRRWDWTFGDGGVSTSQNPSHTYSTEGTYYVTLTATDNANQSCVRTKGPLIIQKPIPKWREVAPR